MIDATLWADRPHRGPRAEALELSADEREKVEAIVRLPSTEQRIARRGQAVLLFADRVATADVAMLVGIDYRTARKVYDYMIWHNQRSEPIHWSYRPKSWSASRSVTDGGPS